MNEIEFKIALLDSLSYPISRYKLLIKKPVNEESVREAIDGILTDLTREMMNIEKEENDYLEKQPTSL